MFMLFMWFNATIQSPFSIAIVQRAHCTSTSWIFKRGSSLSSKFLDICVTVWSKFDTRLSGTQSKNTFSIITKIDQKREGSQYCSKMPLKPLNGTLLVREMSRLFQIFLYIKFYLQLLGHGHRDFLTVFQFFLYKILFVFTWSVH